MRMSVHKGDPGYHRRAYSFQPYLDGKLVTRCFTADEDRGLVLRYRTDSEDRYVLSDDGTCLLTECLHGSVEIRKCT